MKTYSIFGPPGTGKTTELVKRIDLLNNKFPNDKILVISFTRAAAKEISDRANGKADFSTIHSLCYRLCKISKSQVVTWEHLKELTKFTGIEFRGASIYDEEQTIGDQMLAIMSLSINRMDPSYKYTYSKISRPPGTLVQFEMVCKSYEKWKHEYGYVDFNDMLLRYDGSPLNYDHVFIDEAQDLSNLQWSLVDSFIENSNFKTVTIAGDDDQSIYEFSGAQYDGMSKFEQKYNSKRIVLNKSYRLPKRIWELADQQVHKIKNRVEKVYEPLKDGGYAYIHSSLNTVPVSSQVDTLYLYRCHTFRKDVEDHLIANAVPYSVIGGAKPGIWDSSWGKAIKIFNDAKLNIENCGMDMLTDKDLKILSSRLDSTAKGIFTRQGIAGLIRFEWWDILNAPQKIINYFRVAMYNGHKIGEKPNIRIATIHGSKGMEADRVILINDVTENVIEEYAKNPDGELRVFYVGMTRAKTELRIIDGSNPLLKLSGISYS